MSLNAFVLCPKCGSKYLGDECVKCKSVTITTKDQK